MTGIGKPVELLRDGRGIYGIGVSDEFDIEALAWACGIDDLHLYPLRPSNLILRSDLLGDNKQKHRPSAVLQRITGGFRHGMFANFCEEHLRRVIHHEALNRAGLPWPPNQRGGQYVPYWSEDKKQQGRNRQIYHGLRRGSLHIINKLIGHRHLAKQVRRAGRGWKDARTCENRQPQALGYPASRPSLRRASEGQCGAQ
jgi:hypothetical protein